MGFSTPLNRKSEKVDLEIAEAKRKEEEKTLADARVFTSNPKQRNLSRTLNTES